MMSCNLKRIPGEIAIYVILVVFVACSRRTTGSSQTLHSRFVSALAPPGWNSPEFDGPDSLLITGGKANSDNRLSVFSRWDAGSLYFFFKVTDSDLRAYQTEKDHPQLFLDDMVEVLIDTRNDKGGLWAEDDIVYHVNLLAVKKDDRGSREGASDPTWDGKARISVQLSGTLNDPSDTDTGYLITLIIPWSEIGQSPHPRLTMGINFANGDNDGKGRQLFDWAAAWPLRSPNAFGDLILTN